MRSIYIIHSSEFLKHELIIPLPDVNSMYDCGDIGDGPEMDDTSLSSRASSRIFDSDQIYSAESMHGGM